MSVYITCKLILVLMQKELQEEYSRVAMYLGIKRRVPVPLPRTGKAVIRTWERRTSKVIAVDYTRLGVITNQFSFENNLCFVHHLNLLQAESLKLRTLFGA